MRSALHVILALMALGAPRALVRGAAAAPLDLKIGMVAAAPFAVNGTDGTLTGFEPDLTRALCTALEATCTPVLMQWADRIPALEDGSVDVIIAGFSVTAEREEQVSLVRPFYYASGVSLFVTEAGAPAITSWADVEGKKICSADSYYGNDELEIKYGAVLVISSTEEEVVANLVAGECAAAITDSSLTTYPVMGAAMDPPAKITRVASAPQILVVPYAIAVAKNNTMMQDWVTGALIRTAMSAGNSSLIFELEQEYVVASGGAPLQELVPLVDSITYLVAPTA